MNIIRVISRKTPKITNSNNFKSLVEYQNSFSIFTKTCNYANEITKANDFVIQRYTDSLSALRKTIFHNYEILRIIFMGVELQEVRDIFKKYRTHVIGTNDYTLKELIFFYNETVFYDEDEAFYYISLAKEMQPTGPWVNNEYHKLNRKITAKNTKQKQSNTQ